MSDKKDFLQIDLSPLKGKQYYSSLRDWHEEVIYFLMVDRFHDGKERSPVCESTLKNGFGDGVSLTKNCGGSLKGVTKELDYIKNMGCTSIWLSPIFQNNPESYHGYAIENFLQVDERFGTKDDLVTLINEAHKRDMKVFLDCVINHSGNNWSYSGVNEVCYSEQKQHLIEKWIRPVFPLELQNPDFYLRKGMIKNWDKYPETIEGDFFSLKKFNLSENEDGLKLQDMLYKIYAYWIKETDCDGFRMDAAKHVGVLPIARFSTKIKRFAKGLGKREFFVFAEMAGDDQMLARFTQKVYSEKEETTYDPVDSLLDFPLHFALPRAIQFNKFDKVIFERFHSLKKNLLTENEHFSLVTFLDNHDQIEKPAKARIAHMLGEDKLILALRVLFTLPGVPCLYYGTEQGLTGSGPSDAYIRELMFDLNSSKCLHSPDSIFYKEIQILTKLRIHYPALVYGSLERADVSEGTGGNVSSIISYTRKWKDQELVIVYNYSENETKQVSVKSKRNLDKSDNQKLKVLYGGEEEIEPYLMKKEYQLFQFKIPPLKFLILI